LKIEDNVMQTPALITTRAGLLLAVAATSLMVGCNQPVDFDLRDLSNGFDTTDAALNPPNRPRPDDRGVISYPNYQVVVAQQGDTVRSVATRIGVDAATLASYNGIDADATLRRDEVIALPSRVAEPTSAIQGAPIDVTTIASAAIDRAGPTTITPTALPPAATAPAATTAQPTSTEPIRHQVQRGETPYSIARLYNVPVRSIAEWNGLGSDLAVREGQFLLIPAAGSSPPPSTVVTPPGVGSETPVPPSAVEPLPDEDPTAPLPPEATPPTPDIGEQTAPASNAQFVQPVAGSIIRAYAPGRNEGIDIGATAGAEVRAAAAGTVAAVTTDTNGIKIVVIRHAGGLLTVYTHVDNLTVVKDATVSQGQVIGQVRAGDPAFVHFEVRQGTQSADPGDYLP
jgi:lipoprotein NlpD